MNHLLGHYVIYAFNDPNSYPSEPLLSRTKKSELMSNDEMEKVGRRNTIMLGGDIVQ